MTGNCDWRSIYLSIGLGIEIGELDLGIETIIGIEIEVYLIGCELWVYWISKKV